MSLVSPACRDALAHWLDTRRALEGAAENTITAYRGDVTDFLAFMTLHQGSPQGLGALERIVEFSDATEAERAIDFCNSGILAGRADVLRRLLPQIRNDNAKGEYYLTDVVALARAEGHRIATAQADPLEVTGVNSQAELAALEQQLTEHADG